MIGKRQHKIIVRINENGKATEKNGSWKNGQQKIGQPENRQRKMSGTPEV